MAKFGVRKGLLIEKVPTKEMGELMVPQIHLAHWPRVFKGLGEPVVEVLVGKV